MEQRDAVTTAGWSSAPVGYRAEADWRRHAVMPEPPAPVVPVLARAAPTPSGPWIASALATLVVVAVSAVVRTAPTPAVSAVVLVAAAAVGMPHGALDILAGPALAMRSMTKRAFVIFLMAYVMVSALAVAGWLYVPVAGVIAFFAMSWFHFGSGDAGGDRVRWSTARVAHAVCSGGIVIALPTAVHPARVLPMVNALFFGRTTLSLSQLTRLGSIGVAVAALAFILVFVYADRDERGLVVAELSVLAALFLVADPLIAFAVYFCVWHGPRHTGRVLRALPSGLPKSASGLLVAAATLLPLLGAGALLLTHSHVSLPSSESLYRIVFVTLGALTAPHLAVTAIWERRSRKG
jgi:beta-carotene 15,15'-dioxygenase